MLALTIAAEGTSVLDALDNDLAPRLRDAGIRVAGVEAVVVTPAQPLGALADPGKKRTVHFNVMLDLDVVAVKT